MPRAGRPSSREGRPAQGTRTWEGRKRCKGADGNRLLPTAASVGQDACREPETGSKRCHPGTDAVAKRLASRPGKPNRTGFRGRAFLRLAGEKIPEATTGGASARIRRAGAFPLTRGMRPPKPPRDAGVTSRRTVPAVSEGMCAKITAPTSSRSYSISTLRAITSAIGARHLVGDRVGDRRLDLPFAGSIPRVESFHGRSAFSPECRGRA